MTNKTFLITRAQHQSLELISAIEKNEGSCVLFPCIEICKPSDQTTLTFATTHFHEFDLCIFTSANAVLPQLKIKLHDYHKSLIAIGPATAKHLTAYTKNPIILPETDDSEGLIKMSELKDVADLNIAIFTGENPRKLLQDTLQSRGARVQIIHCYKRCCPFYTSDKIDAIARLDYAGIIVMSKETLNNLITLFQLHENWLKKQPLIVISQSIATTAKAYGFQEIKILNSDHLWRLT